MILVDEEWGQYLVLALVAALCQQWWKKICLERMNGVDQGWVNDYEIACQLGQKIYCKCNPLCNCTLKKLLKH